MSHEPDITEPAAILARWRVSCTCGWQCKGWTRNLAVSRWAMHAVGKRA